MIVRLCGGLGNQLFSFAFGVSLSRKRNEDLLFHKHELGKGKHRAYSLDAFSANLQFTNSMSGPIYQEKTFAYDADVLTAPKGSYYVGNYQSERYVDEAAIRPLLTLRNPISPASLQVAHKIKSCNSVSVHVRRTDYLLPSVRAYHGNMDMGYYERAMDQMRSRVSTPHFVVFSDDPSWCKTQFLTKDVTIVDHNGWGSGTKGPSTEHEDLHLMSLCQHAIIPNSSFGWWGAWLNPDKSRIVIAPKKWFGDAGLDERDIVPERWVKM